MPNVIIETVSGPWTKALASNKQGDFYEPIQLWPGPPDAVNPNTLSGFNAPGVVDMGQGGGVAPNRMLVMPYAEGQPGYPFSMILWGWRPVGTSENDPAKSTWICCLLAEFLCILGDIPGPHTRDNVQTTNAILPTENICDGLTMRRGVAGRSGFLSTPGGGIPAYAGIELFGAKKVSFDFAADRDLGPISMNCLWTRA